MENIDKLIEEAKTSTPTTPTPRYVNLLDALDDNSFLDYSFKDKQFVIIKKSKYMATLDFVLSIIEFAVFGALAIGLLILAF